MITLTYLEFYSGIGGWGYAIEHACRLVQAAAAVTDEPSEEPTSLLKNDNKNKRKYLLELECKLVAAYDHSDLCNSVFCHNHNSISPSPSTLSSATPSRPSEKSFCRPRQTPIERLTTHELETHSASLWCLSPPCQPHTRQHSNQFREKGDPRSKSFLHLCDLLSKLKEESLPSLILLENVVGFEKEISNYNKDRVDNFGENIDGGRTNMDPTKIGSFQTWRKALSERHYHVGHFCLNPTDVGIPNDRPRYYCVAFRMGKIPENLKFTRRGELSISKENSKILIENFAKADIKKMTGSKRASFVSKRLLQMAVACSSMFKRETLLDQSTIIHNGDSLSKLPHLKTRGILENALPSIRPFLDADLNPEEPTAKSSLQTSVLSKREMLRIPKKVRDSSCSWCFDVVTPFHQRSSCFTHSYGKFVRGTGSILYTGTLREDDKRNEDNDSESNIPSIDRFRLVLPEERIFSSNWSDGLDWDCHLRYFSGTEIARLMGFPVSEPGICDLEESSKITEDISTNSHLNNHDQNSYVSNHEGTKQIRQFSFPPSCTMKQQWKLLGNSINVQVAACVAEIGILSIINDMMIKELFPM